MKSFLSPLLLIFLSLVAGYLFGRIFNKKIGSLKKIRIVLQRVALQLLNPIAFLGAVWITPLKDLKIISIPFVGATAIITGGFLAFIYCKAKGIGRKQTGSLITSGAFTNIGSVGGIIVFFFLGEPGFSIVPLYKLFEELVNYGIGFPVAKSYSDHVGEKESRLKAIFKDPFIMSMLTAITIGLILNFSGAVRPGWYASLNSFLITGATVLLLLSIGMAFHFTSIKRHYRNSIAIAVIKSLMVPTIIFSIAMLLGLNTLENGLVIKVILILSAMPSGFASLVPPTVYDLDIDLSNTSWLFTMGTLIYTVPILYILLSLI
ncbi:MAG: hypothetical protein OCD02_19905 [Spirochaetaceae bacterium]